jgi:hypothetical protein
MSAHDLALVPVLLGVFWLLIAFAHALVLICGLSGDPATTRLVCMICVGSLLTGAVWSAISIMQGGAQ